MKQTVKLSPKVISSRMRTGRSLTVCGSLLPGGVSSGGGSHLGGLIPGGLWFGGVSAPRGVSALGGVCSREVSAWGMSAPRGGVISQHALRQTPPPSKTESQMPVKTLPWPNFVVAGKYEYVVAFILFPFKRLCTVAFRIRG